VSVREERSNQLNYVPTLFSYLYSLNANASNEQLILNQLLGNRRKPPGNGRSAAIDPMTVQIVGSGEIYRN
jgi:hypothetical protein